MSFRRIRKSKLDRLHVIYIVLVCLLLAVFVYNSLLDRLVPTSDQGQQGNPAPRNHTKSKRLPQAIVIGSRKSGTRALVRFLEINPSIRSAHNEVHFFDKLANFRRGLAWYQEQMPETTAGQVTIEKSPAYLVTREAPERVKSMNSSIKLIVILRDPVTRLISDFSQLVANRMDKRNLSEDYDRDDELYLAASQHQKNDSMAWLEAEKEFEAYVLRPDGGIDDSRRAIRVGMYSVHLERWLAHFSPGQFHFVDGERLISRPYEELRKLEPFLGLEPAIKPTDFVFNGRKGFYCIRANSNSNNNNYNSSTSQTSTAATEEKENEPICLSKSKGRRHVRVSEQLTQQLRDFYAPYNDYLFALTGIKF